LYSDKKRSRSNLGNLRVRKGAVSEEVGEEEEESGIRKNVPARSGVSRRINPTLVVSDERFLEFVKFGLVLDCER